MNRGRRRFLWKRPGIDGGAGRRAPASTPGASSRTGSSSSSARCRSPTCRRRWPAARWCSSATCTSARASTTTTSSASSIASARWPRTSSCSPATSPRTIGGCRRTRAASTRTRRSAASRRSASSATTITVRAGAHPELAADAGARAGRLRDSRAAQRGRRRRRPRRRRPRRSVGEAVPARRPRSPIATRAKPALVLSHNPDTADVPGWLGYEGWILSGHTHGGQCKPPFLPPPLLPVRNRRYTSGEIDGRRAAGGSTSAAASGTR